SSRKERVGENSLKAELSTGRTPSRTAIGCSAKERAILSCLSSKTVIYCAPFAMASRFWSSTNKLHQSGGEKLWPVENVLPGYLMPPDNAWPVSSPSH